MLLLKMADAISMKFTASATAQAINEIMRVDNCDKEALLEMIADYFDDDEESSQRQADPDLSQVIPKCTSVSD